MSVKSRFIAGLAVCARRSASLAAAQAVQRPPRPLRRAAHVSGAVEAWGRFGGGGGRGRVTGDAEGHRHGRRRRPGAHAADDRRRHPGDVRQISTSNSDGYALTRNGAVYAWGAGGQGELGDGAPAPVSLSAVRVRFPPG